MYNSWNVISHDQQQQQQPHELMFMLEAASGFLSTLNLSYEAWNPHETDIAIIWDINDECSWRKFSD